MSSYKIKVSLQLMIFICPYKTSFSQIFKNHFNKLWSLSSWTVCSNLLWFPPHSLLVSPNLCCPALGNISILGSSPIVLIKAVICLAQSLFIWLPHYVSCSRCFIIMCFISLLLVPILALNRLYCSKFSWRSCRYCSTRQIHWSLFHIFLYLDYLSFHQFPDFLDKN